MAEAVCGPSNALQQFKQHAHADRTLQQDRLAARPPPAHAFRSPNPYAGALDSEFEAFHTRHTFPLPENGSQFHPPAGFGSATRLQAPSWAADFQRMSICQPSPLQQQQQHFQPSPSSADWAQDFREHLARSPPLAQNSSPSPQAFQQRARSGLLGFQSRISQPLQPSYAQAAHQAKGKAPVTEHSDEAAFAAAFDQARDDMMAGFGPVEAQDLAHEELPLAQELIDEVTAERYEAIVEQAATEMLREPGHDMDMEEFTPLSKVHAGADVEHDPIQDMRQEEPQQEQKPAQDDDALAATAEELLEKVKHNQSDKFKNSQFLGLMRKLRDREVRVEGDKMVEIERPPSTAAAHTTLNTSSTVRPSERVYHPKTQPAALPLDTRPPHHGIPNHEQDHDHGRIDPADGQGVVDLLNHKGPITADVAPADSLSEMLSRPNDSLAMQTAPFGGI